MNDVLENINSRRSIKKYDSRMVDKETIDKIVAAGLAAPSGHGQQAASLVVITNKDVRDRLARLNASILGMTDFDPFYGAPVVIVVLANKQAPTYIYDGSCCIENMLLAASSLGIGSCWIHRAKEEFETEEGKELLREFGIDGDFEGIGHCILGYKADEGRVPTIKDNRVFYVE